MGRFSIFNVPSCRRSIASLALLVTLTIHATAVGQIVVPPPAGVFVDPEGVVRTRAANREKPDARNRHRPANAIAKGVNGVVHVSLPRLFAAAAGFLNKGAELPEEIRCLAGMVRARELHLFPEERDLVLVGDAEPIFASDPHRPVGEITGRPTLRLEDFALALRCFGPGGQVRNFGCTIELTEPAVARMNEVARSIGVTAPGREAAIAKRLAGAVGPQPVRVFGVPDTANFAFVCVEADYILKRLAIGLEPFPVKQVKSHFSMLRSSEPTYTRYWFVPAYDPLRVSANDRTFVWSGPRLRLNTSMSATDNDAGASASAKRFVANFSEHFEELQRFIPGFADLANLADLAVVSALIAADRLHEKCGWDPTSAVAANRFPIPERPAPRSAETLVNYKGGRSVIFSVGGVEISPESVLRTRTRLEGATAAALRSSGEWYLAGEPNENAPTGPSKKSTKSARRGSSPRVNQP